MLLLRRGQVLQQLRQACWRRWLTQCCTGAQSSELSSQVKHQIEAYWRSHLGEGRFDAVHADASNKFYVLSMFPYPSGNLHMGHVRVYTIGDAVARFQRMCGKNVFQPIGWDAFGLPAENAALQRGIEPTTWTHDNIARMKQQLQTLGCSFDWKHELSTCNADYYKWTQQLFLMLHEDGLAYQNEALVNWDPVDKTVLADEQVDANGCSWRSGAKVEKKLLKQWFVRTTAFAENLLDGLGDPSLKDWRDIINLQRHWIGECDGYAFQLLTSASNLLRVWTPHPEYFKDPNAFVVLKQVHFLAKMDDAVVRSLTIENPFTGTTMPVVFSDVPDYPDKCDVHFASPHFSAADRELQQALGLSFVMPGADEAALDASKARAEVLETAQRLRLGGHRVSARLQDWLISRQRYWGTPIPIVHCAKCGAVPVPPEQLPVVLPPDKEHVGAHCTCPQCGSDEARRETDTMDTFVDSSWYYLRFFDPHNATQMFDEHLADQCMPVDLYIGGKEHAVLHLYYARFVNHYLHSRGLVPTPEPFSRLLVQGMVMGRSYRVKGTGRYVSEQEVDVVNAKKNQAALKATKEPVVMSWEKMSKSKLNGVDPADMFDEYGTDTTRLIILADVAPTSHRNWSSATFPGILNWQKRLWLTVDEFCELRQSLDADGTSAVDTASAQFLDADMKLFDARNYYVKGTTFNYRYSHQLSVGISKMQGLTNSLRRAPKEVICHGRQYERALASQLVMLAPMAPHFASELWAKFANAPHRLNAHELRWKRDVLEQRWPEIDLDYALDLTVRINGYDNCAVKMPRVELDKVTHSVAMDVAFRKTSVIEYLVDKRIRTTNFVLYPGIEAVLDIFVDKAQVKKPTKASADVA